MCPHARENHFARVFSAKRAQEGFNRRSCCSYSVLVPDPLAPCVTRAVHQTRVITVFLPNPPGAWRHVRALAHSTGLALTSSSSERERMVKLFKDSTFNQPLNRWNVSNVKNMSHMFEGASLTVRGTAP